MTSLKKIITLSGDIGSGKSSVSAELVALTGYEIVGTGNIQREIARKRGVTTLELNQISVKDKSIDHEIDQHVIQLGKSNQTLIIDSRLAWHFIPAAFKVFLSVDNLIGAERVYGAKRDEEDNPSVEKTLENNAERSQLEVLRFKQLYNVNLKDYANFDLIIDTSYATPEAIAIKIQALFDKHLAHQPYSKCWLSPKRLIPTEPYNPLFDVDEEAQRSSTANSSELQRPEVSVFAHQSFFYQWQSQQTIVKAIHADVAWVPGKLIASRPDDLLPAGQNVQNQITKIHRKWLMDWEQAMGFKFKCYPPDLVSES